MSPEQFSGTPYNHKSDIWALGCCVYEIATLRHAFSADNISSLMYNILHGVVHPLPADNYSSELSSLVLSMLAHIPDNRPSVQQILKMDYVKSHIRKFLGKADERKRLRIIAVNKCHFILLIKRQKELEKKKQRNEEITEGKEIVSTCTCIHNCKSFSSVSCVSPD